jgi:hypothetical protein
MGLYEGNQALNVVLHGVTNLRNLAEVRIREEIRKQLHLGAVGKAQQYVSQVPMEMKKMLPDQLPQIVDMQEPLDYVVEEGKTRADSLVGRFKHLMERKASEQPEKGPQIDVPTTIGPSQKPSPDVPPEAKEDRPARLLFPLAFGEKKADKGEEPKEPKKPKTKSRNRIKKSQKGKGKQVDRENEPPAPVEAQPDDEADQATQEPDSALEGLPEVRLDRGHSIVEIPTNARVHSISDDIFLVENPPLRPHSLDLDSIVPFDKARLSHILEHDQIIPEKPAPEEHRLSKDTMIPKPAVTPGHFLEGDPVVSGPRPVFSHEILDDPIVERAKAFLPHTLESDKKIAAAEAARAHSLASDAVLPAAPRPGAAHDLESDKMIAAPTPGRGEHDISRDVRILSPSGQVRTTHTIEDDEVIREGAQFRKSPRPDAAAMPGNWASSSTSEEGVETNKNLVGSLNAVIDSADRALDDLGRPSESGKENKAAGTYQ